MTEVPLPDRLRDLAQRADRLRPDHRDPERFFLDRSELAAELRRLAARVRGRAAA